MPSFRVPMNAAPLKPVRRFARVWVGDFPRSYERGPIEAVFAIQANPDTLLSAFL